jgi:mono/diheme cytochrome c family protein
MKNIEILLLVTFLFFVISCGGSKPQEQETTNTGATVAETPSANSDDRGIGPIKEVPLTNPLDTKMVESGKSVYELKCSSCHKLTDEKLVGPGWKGVTKRRKPEWIMNFTVNVDEMLNKDPNAIAMLEQCLVRMPNQNISEPDARNIVEFMRQNDGEK